MGREFSQLFAPPGPGKAGATRGARCQCFRTPRTTWHVLAERDSHRYMLRRVPSPPVLTLKPQLLVPPDAAALEEKVLREMIKTRLSGRSPNPTAPGPSQERRRRQEDEREGKSTREHSEKAADCEATRGLRKSRTCRT